MQTTVPALQQQFPQLLSAEEPACMTEPDGGQSRTNDTNDSGQHPCAVLCVLSMHISCYRAAGPMDQPVVLLDYQQPCTANQFDPRELGWGAAEQGIRPSETSEQIFLGRSALIWVLERFMCTGHKVWVNIWILATGKQPPLHHLELGRAWTPTSTHSYMHAQNSLTSL